MKNTILFLAALLCLPLLMFSQKVEITPFGGYVFAGDMQGDYGDIRIDDNAQYGGQISIAVSRVVDIDLIYNRSDTRADITYLSGYGYNGLSYQEIPLSINYMQVGFTKNFRVHPKISPYLGMNLGASLWAPKEEYADQWFFSVGVLGGAKFYLGNRFGLKIQAQGYVPVQGTAFSMFVGTGGSSAGVSVYSTLFQFGFTGGLIFRLGKVQ